MINHDKLILKVILDKSGKIHKGYYDKIKNKYPNINNYLLNRYEYTTGYKETLIRMKYGIEIRPTCPICGNHVYFIGLPNSKGIYSKHCSEKCSSLDKNVQLKTKTTNKLKYGVDWHTQSENFKDKARNTWLEKYGVENACQSEIVKEHINKIKEEKYGSKTYNNIEKAKKTCLEKYGVDSWFKTKENHSEELEKQRIETMKRNHSFGNKISKQEKEIYNLLINIFPQTKTQYRSKEYPFVCDFYIPEINTYIEYQGSQFHHFHPFDENNQDDINELNRLKELEYKKISENRKTQYTQMINTWTNLDVKKRNTAKENNLNYLEFFTMKDFNIWYKKISNQND